MNKEEYADLKRRYLGGLINFCEVKERLYELDQADIYKAVAELNLEFLYDKDIITFVSSRNDQDKEEYNNILSLTEFHVGQKLVADYQEIAVEHFRKALESSLLCPCNIDWSNYLTGTITYLEGERIDEYLIDSIEDSNNANTLRNFNNGIRSRGYPSYMEDYIK